MRSMNVQAGEPVIEWCRAGWVEMRVELNEEETFGSGILPSPLLVGQNGKYSSMLT